MPGLQQGGDSAALSSPSMATPSAAAEPSAAATAASEPGSTCIFSRTGPSSARRRRRQHAARGVARRQGQASASHRARQPRSCSASCSRGSALTCAARSSRARTALVAAVQRQFAHQGRRVPPRPGPSARLPPPLDAGPIGGAGHPPGVLAAGPQPGTCRVEPAGEGGQTLPPVGGGLGLAGQLGSSARSAASGCSRTVTSFQPLPPPRQRGR